MHYKFNKFLNIVKDYYNVKPMLIILENIIKWLKYYSLKNYKIHKYFIK